MSSTETGNVETDSLAQNKIPFQEPPQLTDEHAICCCLMTWSHEQTPSMKTKMCICHTVKNDHVDVIFKT